MNIGDYFEKYKPHTSQGDLKNFIECCFFELLRSYRNLRIEDIAARAGQNSFSKTRESLNESSCELYVLDQLISMESKYKIKAYMEEIMEEGSLTNGEKED